MHPRAMISQCWQLSGFVNRDEPIHNNNFVLVFVKNFTSDIKERDWALGIAYNDLRQGGK